MNIADADMLKKYFQYLINREMEKQLNEQDSELINECVDFILILDGQDINQISKADIEKAKIKVFERANMNSNKVNRPKRLRKGVLIACAVLMSLVIISGVTSAFDWEYSIKNLIKTMNVGDVADIEYGELEEVNKKIEFNTYKALTDYIGYDLLYPAYLPDDVVLDKIYYAEDDNKDIFFTYSYDEIELRYRVNNNHDWFDNVANNSKTLAISIFDCYVSQVENNEYQIVFISEEKVYSFYSNDYNELLKVIERLELEKIK